MRTTFDFLVIGAGSSGAVIASRLSEDPNCRVALIEAGEHPPDRELVPVAATSLQGDPETDWMYDADSGQGGLALANRRMPVARGKMLGGSSALNYMVYVRGHPQDFDGWAERGAEGWSYQDVLPYFRKSEDFKPSLEVAVDGPSHGTGGPMSVAIRSPVLGAARAFVEAAAAVGIPRGDYNGVDRGGPRGVVSLVQTNTRNGTRSSTYHAFIEGEVERRPNLTLITGARVLRILLEGGYGSLRATGIECRTDSGEFHTLWASREVVVCAGAVGSPHLLMVSGIGPRSGLEAVGVLCRHDLPAVGVGLKDHLHCAMRFSAPGIGVSLDDISISLGPDELRAPTGPLPAEASEDAHLSADLSALKAEAERRLSEWTETGNSLASSSLYDAIAFYASGYGDLRNHDAQIGFVPSGLTPGNESVILLPTLALPRSEGELTLRSADSSIPPEIRMGYFTDPVDLTVMVAVMRRALDIVANWPAPAALEPLSVPERLLEQHGHKQGAPPSDELLADMARHYATSVGHLSCSCRMGRVVDSQLRVFGVAGLRIADASVMPEIVSGATNATSIMIGERAAELLARDHGIALAEFVGA